MLFAFLIFGVLVVGSALVWADRQNRYLADAHKEHLEQVQYLLQRIQAPEAAVIQHQIENSPNPDAVMPLSDYESARREEAEKLQRMIADMEETEARLNGR